MTTKTPDFKYFSTSGRHRAAPNLPIKNTGETRADQEAAKYASIDYILNQFTRTNMLPTVEVNYADLTNVPKNLTDMHAHLDRIYDEFQQLPSSIRLQMNNDVRNYPDFVQSPEGSRQLIDLGYMKDPNAAHSGSTSSQSQATPPSDTQQKASETPKS